jgi:hypothetical protein
LIKGHVKRGVVDDDFSVLQVGQQFVHHGVKLGFVAQKLGGDAVYLQSLFVAVAPGVEVEMQVAAGELAVDQLHAADLDHAVAGIGRQAGGLGVQENLTHQ